MCLFSSAHALHQFHLIDSLTLAQKTFKLSSVPASFVSPPVPRSLSPPSFPSKLSPLQPVTSAARFPVPFPPFLLPALISFAQRNVSGWFPQFCRPPKPLYQRLHTWHPVFFLIPLIKVKLVSTEHQLVFNEIRGRCFGAITVLSSLSLLFWTLLWVVLINVLHIHFGLQQCSSEFNTCGWEWAVRCPFLMNYLTVLCYFHLKTLLWLTHSNK